MKVKKIGKLSPMQEGILYQSLLNDENKSLYNEILTLNIDKCKDIEHIINNIKKSVNVHSILNSAIVYKNLKNPQLVEMSGRNPEIKYLKYENVEKNSHENIVKEIKDEYLTRGFDLAKDNLIRFSIVDWGKGSYTIVINFHHIILDGWSMGIILKEILFGNFLIEEDNYLEVKSLEDNKDIHIAKEYWENRLKAYDFAADLPIESNNILTNQNRKELNFNISDELAKKIENFAGENGVSVCSIYQFAVGILLSLYNRNSNVLFGNVISGRSNKKANVENCVGLYINTIPLLIKFDNNKSIIDNLKTLQRESILDEENGNISLAELKSLCKSKEELFKILFTFENYPLEVALNSNAVADTELKITSFDMYETTNYDFNITVIPHEKSIRIIFNPKSFEENYVGSIPEHIKNILLQIVDEKCKSIEMIKLLTEKEENDICCRINEFDFKFDNPTVIIKEFERCAEKFADNIAITNEEEKITYKELNYKANIIANTLFDAGVKSGDIVGIILDKSVNMIASILGILKIRAAYLPISPEFPDDRINYMLEDANCKTIISDNKFEGRLKKDDLYQLINVNSISNLKNVQIRYTITDYSSEDIIYLIYTSGTTGKPKGAMITNKNLYSLLKNQKSKFSFSEKDVWSFFHSFCFDFSVWEIFGPLLYGGKIVIINKNKAQDSDEFWNILNEEKVSILNQTPASFYNLADVDETKESKLNSLRYIIFGGEALHPAHLKIWHEKYPDVKLINMYGITETTIHVTYKEITDYEIKKDISNIGKPIPSLEVYILDQNLNILPIGVPGEICVAGLGVCKGYINNEELTKQKFINRFGKTIYRSGDLGRVLENGEIEYLGRIDKQVKIRGYRIEIGEIETALLNHKNIKSATVVAKEINGIKNLFAYVVTDEKLENLSIREYLSKLLPQYMIPSQIIKLDKLPLTVNGKVDIKNLPEVTKHSANRETSITEVEKNILEIWENVLGIKGIGVEDDFFDLGGHSISMMKIISLINKSTGFKIPFKDFFKHSSVRELCKYLQLSEINREEDSIPYIIGDVEHINESFPLTDIQLSYFLGRENNNEMGGVSTHLYMEVDTSLNIKYLSEALNRVIKRHPMLRCVVNKKGQQHIIENCHYEIQEIDIRNKDKETKEKILEDNRKYMETYIFDPMTWPMFEFKAYKLDDVRSRLCIGFDPIIADAGSMRILGKELIEFYNNPTLDKEDIKFSFRDYILGKNELKKTKRYQEDKEFWLNQMDDFPLAPKLPMITNPLSVKKPTFKRLSKKIDYKLWEKIKNFSKENRVTPISFLVTRYAEVLNFWSNQDNFAINFTVADRIPFNKDVDKIIGDFTSLLLINVDYKNTSNLIEKMHKVQDTLSESMDHRLYDGVEFIQEISRRYDLSGKAIMPIVFSGALGTTDNINSWELLGESVYGVNQTSQVYLDNQVVETPDGIIISWDYVEQIFDRNVIETMFSQYIDGIENYNIEENYEISDKEKKIWKVYNSTKGSDSELLLHELFEHALFKFGKNIAIEYDEESITYNQLNKMANQIANKLVKTERIGLGDRVAIHAERRISTVAALLGILKVGATYVPIDPELPSERRKYIMQNSNSTTFIEPQFYSDLEDYNEELNIEYSIPKETIAYIIYTSGSTGKPKGVLISHEAAVNTILDINNKIQISETDKTLGISSLGFDLSVYDIFGTLGSGACLVLIDSQKDIKLIEKILFEKNITIWNSVPAILELVTKRIGLKNKQKLFWAPSKRWNEKEEKIYISDKMYPNMDVNQLRKIYELAYNGIPKERLLEESKIDNKVLEELIEDNVLVETLEHPVDIFKAQEKLYSDNASEEIMLYKDKAEKYKKEVLDRIYNYNGKSYQLPNEDTIAKKYLKRHTTRNFNPNKKISLHQFLELLAILKQYRDFNGIRYAYASAGGLYPIDIYLYIKEGMIDNLERGFYYYSPKEHKLIKVNDNEISVNDHFFTNQEIYRNSSFSFLFVYNADANMKKYNGLGYFLACIDLGIIVDTISRAADEIGIGTCSIGNMKFKEIGKKMFLNSKQILLHAMECGPSDTDETCINEKMDETLVFEEKMDKVFSKNFKLRKIILSGDWIPLSLIPQINTYFPGADVISCGGATEAAIWSIYYPIKEVKKEWKSIPYGYPLENQNIYILNSSANLCPINTEGEIYIGGKGIAEGYDNDPIRTKESFITHPEYGKLYKTGDQGVMRAEGYIEFLGRKDFQVKIQGMRIELEEIENVLTKFEKVQMSKVIVREEKNNKLLVAYYVSEEEYDEKEIRKFLSNHLPKYMIPTHIIFMKEFPLTSNGKIDVKALPNKITNKKITVNNKAESDIEIKLSNIWKEVLEVDTVDIKENFFDMGGNSLMLIKAHNLIDNEYPDIIKITELFNYPSIKKLAAIISDRVNEQKKFHTLELPEIFFTNSSNYVEDNINRIYYRLNSKLSNSVAEIAKTENVDEKYILFTICVLSLSQFANKESFSIYYNEQNVLKETKINLTEINTFEEAVQEIKSKFENSLSIMDYKKVDFHKNEILPVFDMDNSLELEEMINSMLIFRCNNFEKVEFETIFNERVFAESGIRKFLEKYEDIASKFLVK